MYYGNSLFADEVSMLYSRGYGYFLREGIIKRSIKTDLYTYYLPEGSKNDENPERIIPLAEYNAKMEAFDRDVLALVEKIKYCDYIFEKDYFANEGNFAQFKGRMLTLNGK
jgi:hypothetical protein